MPKSARRLTKLADTRRELSIAPPLPRPDTRPASRGRGGGLQVTGGRLSMMANMERNSGIKTAVLVASICWALALLLEWAWFHPTDRRFAAWCASWVCTCECVSLGYFLRLRRPATGAIVGFVVGLVAAVAVPWLLIISVPPVCPQLDL